MIKSSILREITQEKSKRDVEKKRENKNKTKRGREKKSMEMKKNE